jgi:hypothetical protein
LMTAIQFVLFEPVDWVAENDRFKEVSDEMLELIIGQCKWIRKKYGQT